MPSLIPSSTINNITQSVNNSNFTFIFLNMLAMIILVTIRNVQDQARYTLMHMFLKFSNTSGSNKVSLARIKSWYSPRFFNLIF